MNRRIRALTAMFLCVATGAIAGKAVLNDGRQFEGNVIEKGSTITVVADGKLYQFPKAQVKTYEVAAAEKDADAPPEKKVKNPMIKITTAKGDLTVELFEDKVPNTVANMISLAESGFYKGMRFHRIIPGFMAQGGCPFSKPDAGGRPGTGGPGYRFADEIDPSLKHDGPGILSMANSGPNTNGSQFFLCFKATPWLDGRHAVFGKVVDGLEVLQKLEAAGTKSGQPDEQIEFNIEVIAKGDHPYEVKKL